eukprot:TRINITY_DN10194_c0_g1_i1.p1 TRINITY_DN10194_c0_g1~~TRINITY_DN10194_c0_g1_i1.p1  ORF type:complete len:1253 (-),score=288.15 TRINITY_DN10194_c0_g1_i1:490-4248(-)
MDAQEEPPNEDVWVAADDSDTEGEIVDRDGAEVDMVAGEDGDIQLVNIVSIDDKPEPRGQSKSSLRFLDWWNGIQSSLPFGDGYSSLHKEIEEFCLTTKFTQAEEAERGKSIEQIEKVVKTVWPSAEIKLFGSTASGLALPGSDIDLTIVPNTSESAGHGKQQPTTNEWLGALSFAFKKKKLCRSVQKIGKAKVPILKCVLHNGLACDVSFNVTNGPTVIPLIRSLLDRFPALRPLCLVLKCFLGQRSLNEVFKGGIGSYCLLIMICAHLSEIYDWASEKRSAAAKSDGPAAPAGETLMDEKTGSEEVPNERLPVEGPKDEQVVSMPAVAEAEVNRSEERKKEGENGSDPSGVEVVDSGTALSVKMEDPAKGEFRMEDDLGLLLLSFFARYGMLHDYVDDIISICPGPVKTKEEMGWMSENEPTLLAVEDPQVPGRDIGRNSYRIDVVKAEFNRALALLKINWSKPESLNRILDLSRDRWSLSQYLNAPEVSPSAAVQKRKLGENENRFSGGEEHPKKMAKLDRGAKKNKSRGSEARGESFSPTRGFGRGGRLYRDVGMLGGGAVRAMGPPVPPQGGGILGMAPLGPSGPMNGTPQRPFPPNPDFNQNFHFHEGDEPFPFRPMGMHPLTFHEGLSGPGVGGRGGGFGPRPPPPSLSGPGGRGRPESVAPFMMPPQGPNVPPSGPLMRPTPLGPGPGMEFSPEGGAGEFNGFPKRPRPPVIEAARFGTEGQWIGNVPWQPSGHPPQGMQMGSAPPNHPGMPPTSSKNWGDVGVAGLRPGNVPPPSVSSVRPFLNAPAKSDNSAVQAPAKAGQGQGDGQENSMFILVKADDPTMTEVGRIKGQSAAYERQVVLASQLGVPISRYTKSQWKNLRKRYNQKDSAQRSSAVAMAAPPSGGPAFHLGGRAMDEGKDGGGILGRRPGNNNLHQPFLGPPLPDQVDRQGEMIFTTPGLPLPPDNAPLLTGGEMLSGSGGFGNPPLLSRFGRELEIKSWETGQGGSGSSMPWESGQGGGSSMQTNSWEAGQGGPSMQMKPWEAGQGGPSIQVNSWETGQGGGTSMQMNSWEAGQGAAPMQMNSWDASQGASSMQTVYNAGQKLATSGTAGLGVLPFSGFDPQPPAPSMARDAGLAVPSALMPTENKFSSNFGSLGSAQPYGTTTLSGQLGVVDAGFNSNMRTTGMGMGYGFESGMGGPSIPGGVPPWQKANTRGFDQEMSAGMGGPTSGFVAVGSSILGLGGFGGPNAGKSNPGGRSGFGS